MTVLRPNGEHAQSLDQDTRLAAAVLRRLVLQAPIVVGAGLVAHKLKVVAGQADQHRALGPRHVLHGGRVVPTENGRQLGGAQREFGGRRAGGGGSCFGRFRGRMRFCGGVQVASRLGSALPAWRTDGGDGWQRADGRCTHRCRYG